MENRTFRNKVSEIFVKNGLPTRQIVIEEIFSCFKEFLTEEYGYKDQFVPPEKPFHGNCCCCQRCGQCHEDCVCENNRVYQELNKLD